MSDELDFHLDDFEPVDADSEYAEQRFWAGDFTVLAEHRTTPYGSHSFVVAHDGSATWGVPGAPQIAAIKVARDLSLNTFTFESTYHSSVPFAQNWLIEQGCPPEPISQIGDGFTQPADDLTTRTEQQIHSSGSRYEVLDSDTRDYGPAENWTMVKDSAAAKAPIRVFLEKADLKAGTYTLREGAFADEDAAHHWLEDRSSPLPPPPEYRGDAGSLRTRAALARSVGASAISEAGPDTQSEPSAGAAQRPSPGRSM
ncbi:glycosyl hydrolase [Streptomyces sp. H27-C3]|uniref:glycosyl hydrolase n=1 Tax=Streptomyces sp. H27-C3 TaxID=3046305 RepID=UPI0024BAB112|nr:glycosyl hydrolase [Streptomyces sp. H27-C3]MDJ0465740.1 glycosyl hydrolase [Streptomyces sp. H27-C3]